MKNFFYNRNNKSLALMTDRWHLENLPTNWNRLNFRALSKERLVNGHLSRVRLLADTQTACFQNFFLNTKLFREQS